MKRDFLFACYQSPKGRLLQNLEAAYLQRSITVSCQQIIVQIGGLGFENEFIDFSLYKNFTVIDAKGFGFESVKKIQAKAYQLPLGTESVDMIIVPHLLEFDAQRFQTMREIERVLKPEGLLVIISFNPWSLWVRYQYLLDIKMADTWSGHFISRSRILDWLKLLNFEVSVATEFNLDSIKTSYGKAINRGNSFFSSAYAIKAIKRRYTLIPLVSAKEESRLILVNSLNPTLRVGKHE
jgi:SAM-dependent methyltransferase